MKTVSESIVESVELVQPGDLNINNTFLEADWFLMLGKWQPFAPIGIHK